MNVAFEANDPVAATRRPAASTLYLVPFDVDRTREGRWRAALLLNEEASDRALAQRGAHPDLIELVPPEKKERIGIDQVRDVIRRAQFAPLQAVRKVCLIPYGEALTPEASNALLKVMEEPPRDLAFILLAEHPSDLLPTIVSRSRLARVPPPDPSFLLRRLAAVGYSDEEAHWILRAAGGESEVEPFLAERVDLAASREAAATELKECEITELIGATLGEDPIRRGEALILLLERAADRDVEFLTVGVRTLASQKRETLVRFFRDLLTVCFAWTRSFHMPSPCIEHRARQIRDRFGEQRLQSLCDAIDEAYRGLIAYTPSEAVLFSLLLGENHVG